MPKVDNSNRFGEYSRLRFYNVIRDEKTNVARLGMRDIEVKNRLNNFDFTYWKIPAKYQYRPDLISNFHYGNSRLWWVITLVNDISHPLKELEIEKVLKIPNPNQVTAFLT